MKTLQLLYWSLPQVFQLKFAQKFFFLSWCYRKSNYQLLVRKIQEHQLEMEMDQKGWQDMMMEKQTWCVIRSANQSVQTVTSYCNSQLPKCQSYKIQKILQVPHNVLLYLQGHQLPLHLEEPQEPKGVTGTGKLSQVHIPRHPYSTWKSIWIVHELY